jgi:hypothetical protein
VQLTNADEQSVQIQGPKYCEFEPKGQMLIEMKIQQEAPESIHDKSLKNTGWFNIGTEKRHSERKTGTHAHIC